MSKLSLHWSQLSQLITATFILKATCLAFTGVLTLAAIFFELIQSAAWNTELQILLALFTSLFLLGFLYQLLIYPVMEYNQAKKSKHSILIATCILQLAISFHISNTYSPLTNHPYLVALITLLPTASMGGLPPAVSSFLLFVFNVFIAVNLSNHLPNHYLLFLLSGQILIWLLFSSIISEFRQKTISHLNLIQLRTTQNLLTKQVEQETRLRIAQDLHDELGHINSVLHSQLQEYAATQKHTPEQLQRALDSADQMKTQIRTMAFQIQPHSFDLLNALQQLADNIQQPIIMIKCKQWKQRCRPDIEEAIFRTCQESITNSIRHSNASEIIITLEQTAQLITVCISDNGKTDNKLVLGNGLLNIQQRIAALAGTVEMKLDQQGFRGDVFIPL